MIGCVHWPDGTELVQVADSDIGNSTSADDSYILDMTTVEWVNSPPPFFLKRCELEPWVEKCLPTAR